MIQGLPIKSPPSPGTCSDILKVPTLENASTDCSLDGYSTDEKSEGDDSSSPDVSCYQDPVSQDLTSLIKGLIEITAESQPDQFAPSKHANFTPELSTVAMPDFAPPPGLSTVATPDLTPPPGLNTVAKPDLTPPPGLSTVAMPDPAPTKVTKNTKNVTKKQQRTKDTVTSSAKSKCATPEEQVKAYYQKMHNDMAKYHMACAQQMAKYQMAYAQQCQQYYTAIHAFQMQQYSQQVRMAVGGSM